MDGKEAGVSYDGKITTRLRPDLDHRLRTYAAARRMPLARVINDALEKVLPPAGDIAAMVAQAAPATAEGNADGSSC
jgi:predicted transcriptional regulator